MCTHMYSAAVCVCARNAPSEFGDFFLPSSRVHERSLLIVLSHTIYYMRRYLLGRFIVLPSSSPALLQLYIVVTTFQIYIDCRILVYYIIVDSSRQKLASLDDTEVHVWEWT